MTVARFRRADSILRSGRAALFRVLLGFLRFWPIYIIETRAVRL
jgi:hypothetical protein